MQTGLCVSKHLETTFHHFCEKLLHITFNSAGFCRYSKISVLEQ